MSILQVFRGSMIHSLDLQNLELLEDACVVVDANGRITYFERSARDLDHEKLGPAIVQIIPRGDFLTPGFIDTHNHAPQWPMRGLGQGLHILDWLDQVTFPHEARFADIDYARGSYESCVDGFLAQGITTASYYGSRHAEATCILADICQQKGQRAFVGKCNMNRNAPDYLKDQSAETSLEETKQCVEHIRALDPNAEHALVRPVLTPRFAICCTPELLQGLGQMMAEDKQLAMQTHFNEAQQEIDLTRTLFPDFKNEADLYNSFGLLSKRSILAHCTVMTEYDTAKLAELCCGITHCPIANMTVGGGFMAAPIRQFLEQGIKVGLGTDSGGGFASGMLDGMRQAMIVSNVQQVMSRGRDKPLSLEEVFYLATMGGAKVLCLEDQIGHFAVGKQFDASWITTTASQVKSTPHEDGESLRTSFEKYVMTGDDRNIKKVFVAGRCVKG